MYNPDLTGELCYTYTPATIDSPVIPELYRDDDHGRNWRSTWRRTTIRPLIVFEVQITRSGIPDALDY